MEHNIRCYFFRAWPLILAPVGKEEVKGAASAAPGREEEEAAAARPAAARAVLQVILAGRARGLGGEGIG